MGQAFDENGRVLGEASGDTMREVFDKLTSEHRHAHEIRIKAAAREHSARQLPDIELVSAAVHAAWMESKRAQGVTSRTSETGEELMVPYRDLSDAAKELDRGTVRAVYAAIETASATDELAASYAKSLDDRRGAP